MDNAAIANQLTLLSKLMEIHGENPFKTRSYSHAAFQIDRLGTPLSEMSDEQISGIKGIGNAISKKIYHILHTGEFPLLQEYLAGTPPGILEMLKIKGLGPKKIFTIWKTLEIETPGELLYACNENRLTLYKGFGQKTQENIRRATEFYLQSAGWHLLAEIENYAKEELLYWKSILDAGARVFLTGDILRQCNTIEKIELVIDRPAKAIKSKISEKSHLIEDNENSLLIENHQHIKTQIYCCLPEDFAITLFDKTGSAGFIKKFITAFGALPEKKFSDEKDIFRHYDLPFIYPPVREDNFSFQMTKPEEVKSIIQAEDIKGIIHCHSNWSDGKNSVEEMAVTAWRQGFEYIVISDHSQSAVYANGLKPDRIRAQHALIDELNEKMAPFFIFKGIEADILSDGTLDYKDNILSTFDVVIASVHSNLKMDKERATQRLMNAIANPYTTILGHLTGRLLLSRPGYPVCHKEIIDACAYYNIVIEINAHPRRLDIDWAWIPYAMEKNVMLSVNPDAHHANDMQMIRYGVLSAQKGGLQAKNNLSSLSLSEFKGFLQKK